MGRTQLTYDPKHNIAYLRLREKKGQVDTIRVSDEMNVDIAPDGTVYGIELLNANVHLEPEDNGNLTPIFARGVAPELGCYALPKMGQAANACRL